MKKLATDYLGLKLNSPVIVGSSRLTSNIQNLRAAEENGAGAVVLKSLFEEQIMYHISRLQYSATNFETDDYMAWYTKSHSVDEYLNLIGEAKKYLAIPVIPSINCFSSKGWTDFARNVADSGADALEINVFFMPTDKKKSAADSEKVYFDLIDKLKDKITIPVSLKIGFRFSNVLYIIDQFSIRGVEGVVMFNRFYEPDIDINSLEIVPASVFSNADERRDVLRWIAMASAQNYNLNISASTGVNSGEDVIKYILAGADTVQVCSVLYQRGMQFLRTINDQISDWMTRNNFLNISDFRGKLNWQNYQKPAVFERTQFMKYFSAVD